MKKSALFFLINFLFITFAAAQIQIVPKIGWNKYKFKPAEEDDLFIVKKERGYQVGADMRIGSINYLTVGLHYLVTNDRIGNFTIDFADEIDKTQLRSLRVPLSFGRTFLDLEVFQIHAHLGGIAYFPLSREEEVVTALPSVELFKEVNYAAAVGLGFDIFRLTFDIYYEHGVSDILVSPKGTKQHLWTFSIGYLL